MIGLDWDVGIQHTAFNTKLSYVYRYCNTVLRTRYPHTDGTTDTLPDRSTAGVIESGPRRTRTHYEVPRSFYEKLHILSASCVPSIFSSLVH